VVSAKSSASHQSDPLTCVKRDVRPQSCFDQPRSILIFAIGNTTLIDVYAVTNVIWLPELMNGTPPLFLFISPV
jgi:hypothetical protein